MSNPRQTWLIVVVIVLVVAAAGVILRTVQGDKDAERRAKAVSTPQGIAQVYQTNEHMPPQARAAAEAALRAHGGPMAGSSQPASR